MKTFIYLTKLNTQELYCLSSSCKKEAEEKYREIEEKLRREMEKKLRREEAGRQKEAEEKSRKEAEQEIERLKEEQRQAEERQAVIKKQEEEHAARKRKKMAVIFSVAAIVCIGVFFVVSKVIIPLMKQGEYKNLAEFPPVKFEGHTYAIFNFVEDLELETFDECEDFCESIGGHMAVINSPEENEFLFDYCLSKNRENSFFGYTDQGTENRWRWVDGTPRGYENWSVDPKQPNNKGGREHYAQFYGDKKDGTWNDARFGDQSWRFLCEWEEELSIYRIIAYIWEKE